MGDTHQMSAQNETSWEVVEIANSLTEAEKTVLALLRDDGKGNYNPRLTRARNRLYEKGLADGPMTLGFGGRMISCVQHPTELGVRVQRWLGYRRD